MKRTTIFIGFIAFIILATAGCSKESKAMPVEMPADFDFRLSYGINSVHKVDTYKDLVVKDLVEDGIATTNIKLSEQEMETIYEKMAEINVMGELDFEDDRNCFVEPASESSWKISANGEVREFTYSSYCDDVPKDAQKLLALEDLVRSIVSAKKAYQELPEAKGAYE